MKKIFAIAAAALVLAAPAADAQNILGKLKEKASEAVGSAIGDKISEKVSNATSKIGDKIGEKTGVNLGSVKDAAKSGLPVPDSKETLQPKRSSSFGWDGAVTPSTAKFPIPLMAEFPAVPTAAQLANPTEADQIAYYRAIKAVTLRAEELNKDTTCEDEFTEKWRAEAEKALQEVYGLTAAEMEALKSGTLSPAEEEALVSRMRAKILGGIDEETLMKEAKKAENMPDGNIQNAALSASYAVFDKYDKQLRKYFGCTAAEYKEATRQSMESGNDAASRAIEKKSEAYMKTLDAATLKEAKAFKSTMQKELTKAAFAAVPGADMALKVAQNVGKVQNQLSPLLEKYQKIEKYGKDIMEAWPAATWSDADAKFSATERKKVEDIKTKIYASSNPSEYNALYAQAMDIIKTYRERAAKAWAADVQKRYSKVQTGMSDIIKVQGQAITDGIIPECARWRVPLNLVIEAGDILAEAYSEFPSNYPHMYSEEVERQITLKNGEKPWWPEFYVAPSMNELLNGTNLFKEVDGKVYQFNKGSWTAVSKDYGKNMVSKAKSPASASWKSSDGKREVIFNAEGGFLQLPEGDIIYPAAWEKQGNDIVWVDIVTTEKEDGSLLYQIVKCTYKL